MRFEIRCSTSGYGWQKMNLVPVLKYRLQALQKSYIAAVYQQADMGLHATSAGLIKAFRQILTMNLDQA